MRAVDFEAELRRKQLDFVDRMYRAVEITALAKAAGKCWEWSAVTREPYAPLTPTARRD